MYGRWYVKPNCRQVFVFSGQVLTLQAGKGLIWSCRISGKKDTGSKSDKILKYFELMISMTKNLKENLDSFLAMLAPIGDFSVKALRTTFGYARRHPVRIGITVVAIGLLGSWLASSKKSEYLH